MASTEVREPRQREISGVGDRDEGRSAAKGPSVAPEFGLGSGRTVGSGLVAMRFVAYTAAVLLFLALLPELVAQGDVGTFRENGPIEWLQFAILLVIAVLFLVGAHVAVRSRQLMVCFGLVVLLAATRELDSFL